MIIQTEVLGEVNYEESDIIRFEEGLYGFEDKKSFILVSIADTELPFQWLQSLEDEQLSFILTTPFAFYSEYDFEIPRHVIDQLHILGTDDLAVYSLVVLKDTLEESTINLKAPIIINSKEKKAKQLILNEDYPYKYYLFQNQGV